MTRVSSVTPMLKVMKGLATGGLRPAARVASIASLSLMISPLVFAAERFAAPPVTNPATTSPAGGLVQVTFSLLLVLAAVFAAAWAVRRMRGFGRLAPGAIEIVADVALGQKERAVLVQVGKQQLLLGVAAGSVNTLHVLAEPVAVPRSTVTLGQNVANESGAGANLQTPPHLQFKTILKRSLGL